MNASRFPLLAARTHPETKSRFEALAISQGKTVSRLLNEVVASAVDARPAHEAGVEAGGSERISVRLRPGDRALLNARATERCMKPGSYTAMLLHGHLRRYAPLPIDELNHMKVAVGHLGALARTLQYLTRDVSPSGVVPAELLQEIALLRQSVSAVRETVAALVRTNLESWES